MKIISKTTGFFLALILITLNANSTDKSRLKYSINNDWKFALQIENKEEAFSLSDSLWETVNIPHTWNANDVMDDKPGYYRGTGWYKKEIYLNETKNDKHVFLYFEGANQVAKLYVNGQFVGTHAGGYNAFSFDITPYLSNNQSLNTVYVEVNNEYTPDIPPYKSDFSFFGGIYRDVYLVMTEQVHFDVLDLASSGVYVSTPTVTDTTATVEIKAKLVNESTKKRTIILKSIIKDEVGNEVARLQKTVTMKPNERTTVVDKKEIIKGLTLWSPENPYLYTVVTNIMDKSGTMLDEIFSPLGFRYFHFEADSGFYLNGKHCKLIGTSRHQDYYMKGNALPDDYHYQDMKQIKDMGMNFVRISHYPQDKAVMEACDRLGLLNAVEIPLMNVVKSDTFFNVSKTMQREMIRQNYNHPSTIIWAYMNEIQFTPPGGFKDYSEYTEEELTYFEDINELANILEGITRQEDPYRYTNIPMAGNFERFPVGVASGICEIPMILGWNLYNGWYFEGFEQFDIYVDSLHRVDLKHKPLFITEYGAGADPRIRSEQPRRFDFSIEWQNMFHEHHLQAILERPHIAVSAVWNFADFNSESRKDAVPHINNKGLVNVTRKPKDSYYYYQAVLSNEPMVKIAPVDYDLRAGMQKNMDEGFCDKDIWVYTNAHKITLYHNGEKIGIKNNPKAKEVFTIPFINGKNIFEVVAETNSDQIKDFQEVDFILYPRKLETNNIPEVININIGSTFYFTDNEGNLWQPDKPYQKGNWGYTGGMALERENWVGKLLGAEDNILLTENDPLFQTQRLNINSYKFDVPYGVYDVTFYFSDLLTSQNLEVLSNDLKQIEDIEETSVFDLVVNGKVVRAGLNLQKEYGKLKAVQMKCRVKVEKEEGIHITFNKLSGVPMINAVSVIRK